MEGGIPQREQLPRGFVKGRSPPLIVGYHERFEQMAQPFYTTCAILGARRGDHSSRLRDASRPERVGVDGSGNQSHPSAPFRCQRCGVSVRFAGKRSRFIGEAELSVDRLVAEVQARNPSIEAASSAWRAAARALPAGGFARRPDVHLHGRPQRRRHHGGGGWMVQASQKIPWAGKRALRGTAASAEADAMQGDIGDARLRLSEAATTAFYDYYLARRQIEVKRQRGRLLTQFREIATEQVPSGPSHGTGRSSSRRRTAALESRRTELTRDEQIAIARINTLLHRAADHPLPPPPAKVPLPDSLPAAEALQQAAVAIPARSVCDQARDPRRASQPGVGVPGILSRREPRRQVRRLHARQHAGPGGHGHQHTHPYGPPFGGRSRGVGAGGAASAEYQDRLDQVRDEVQSGLDRASQSQRVVRLYEQKILPAAQRSLDSALANYTSGKLDFLRLLDAERQLNTQREMYYQAIAEYHRRLAELERAVGEPMGTTSFQSCF